MTLVFRDKLILIIVGCALLPLLLADLFWYWQVRAMVMRQMEKDLLAVASVAVARGEAMVDDAVDDLGDFSGQFVFQDVLIDDADQEIARGLTRFIVGHKQFQDLYVVNRRGVVVAAIDDTDLGRSLADDPAPRFLLRGGSPDAAAANRNAAGAERPMLSVRGRQGRPAVFAYLRNGTANDGKVTRGLVIGRQIVADYDSDEVIGALIGVMDWRSVEQELLDISLNGRSQDTNYRLLISDRHSGQVVFDTLRARGLPVDSPSLPTYRGVVDMTVGQSRAFVATVQDRVGSDRRFNWRGHAIIDREHALSEVAAIQESALFIGLFLLMITLLLAYRMARRFSEPIEAVTRAMRKVASGASLRPLKDSRGDEIGDMIAAFDDMAAQRLKTERDMVRSRVEAEKANRAKGDFLAMMSHEIRTPLNGMLGMAQILRQADLSPQDRKRVETIQSSGQVLEALINDLLDMRELEQGNLTLGEATFDMCLMVSGLIGRFRENAVGKGLELKAGPMPGERCLFRGDAARVRQILWNLIDNGIKFTDRGMVSVCCEKVPTPDSLAASGREHVLRVEVRDTGIGMNDDKLRRVFVPFVQVDTSSTRRYGGSGLGLSIVKRLVDLMGGEIRVDSRPAEGTTFTLFLPLAPGDSSQLPDDDSEDGDDDHGADAGSAEARDTRSLNVLVAEDNPVNLMIAKTFLERLGHRVLHAPDGVEAVRLFQSEGPDFIFMDIHMPRMDGVDATLRIRALEDGGARIPIVALTADAVVEQHREFLAAGMDRVVTKPYKQGDLVRAMEDLGRGYNPVDCD